ncbi:MAG: flagellar hook-basal body complex protein FliE [Epsilonproteobacteria bacterium]|nr:flagellar hook-basal body complex protein FliE [Campylobacterota bacterium]
MTKGIDAISPISLLNEASKTTKTEGGSDFFTVLQDSLNEVNEKQVQGDKALSDIATGQVKDLHNAALTIGKAEVSMKMMLEVRNKALSAYKEILKTPI